MARQQTLREQYVEHIEALAADYHRDMGHNKNTKAPDDTPWTACKAPRCEKMQRLVAAFPGSLADEAALMSAQLTDLKRRVDAAVSGLAGQKGDG